MYCAAPEGQKVDACIGLFPSPEQYQCPYCYYAGLGKTPQTLAAQFARRVQADRKKIAAFMQKPNSTANRLANQWQSALPGNGPRSEKEAKGWAKFCNTPNAKEQVGIWAQKQWSKMVEIILVEQFRELLGPGKAPCAFALCLSGSLARREACPHSDIESYIIIKDKNYTDYFKRAGRYVDDIFELSGEAVRGLTFDKEVCPSEHVYDPAGWRHWLHERIIDE
jgi:hypothetical protein